MNTLSLPPHDGDQYRGYRGSVLLSTTNIDEHELIFFSPRELFAELNASQGVSAKLYQDLLLRMIELQQWVERGHTLVVLGLYPLSFTTEVNGEILNNRLPLLKEISITAKTGNRIESVPEKGISDLLGGLATSLMYDVVISGPSLIPLLTVRTAHASVGRPSIVAGYIRLGKGAVVFAPAGEEAGKPSYLSALEQLPPLLHRVRQDYPSWIDSFLTVHEIPSFEDARSRKGQVEKLITEIAAVEAEIESERRLKQLFVGTGPIFEEAVAKALREFDLEVVVGPHPRADLLATNGNRIAAVEAKGVEGAAREEYVRQVAIWMAEADAALGMALDALDPELKGYREQLDKLGLEKLDKDKDCKGILVLGTFRSLPPDQRTEPDFPENVVRVLKRQDVCALTGLQLYCLAVIGRSDPSLKETIRTALFETQGVLDLGGDWRQILRSAGDAASG
jgi:hypothetical protein